MSNTLLTLGHIAREALVVLENNTVFAKYVNREYDDLFAKTGAKIGDTANLRKPIRVTVADGAGLQLQNAEETSTPIKLDKHKHVGLQFAQTDLLLSIDDFSKRFIQPSVAALANRIDLDGLALYKKLYNVVGAPGTVPNASSTYLSAGVTLDNGAAPQDEQRYLVVTSQMHATLAAAEQTLFNDREEISRQYRKGRIGEAHGFKWYMDQNCATHTNGTWAVAGTVNGAGQTGSNLVTAGWTTAALVEGDTFLIDGVYGVNPQSYMNHGAQQRFRVTAPCTDTAGAMTIPIEPAIITSGPFQTVNASPGHGATITMLGASGAVSPQGIAFHRDAMALVMADLPEPIGGAHFERVVSKKLGISMLLTRQFDITNYRNICRLDVLYGWAVIRPELACRVAS